MSVFYDHLVGLDEIHNELLGLNLPTQEHYHLLEVADSTLHHEVLNVILLEIPSEVHEQFLVEFAGRPDNQDHLEFLKQYSPDIEDKISSQAAATRARILEEIRNLQ